MSIAKMWDEKFSRDGYLYGKTPNVYLKEIIDGLGEPKSILFLGEGEGRNACYAARLGHRCHALDASAVGLEKLKTLAVECGVAVETTLLDLAHWEIDREYDAVLCSYLHLDEPLRSAAFAKALACLRPGGVFAGEFFAKAQIDKTSGGPKDADLLYSTGDFEKLLQPGYALETLVQCETALDEGGGHQGEAVVIRVAVRRA